MNHEEQLKQDVINENIKQIKKEEKSDFINALNIIARPKIVILGSSRFKEEISQANIDLSKKGYTVFSLICFDRTKTDEASKDFDPLLKKQLILSHFHKLISADCVFVCNVNGYIGEHTKAEIKLAKEYHKKIIYLEEIKSPEKQFLDVMKINPNFIRYKPDEEVSD